MPMLKRALPAGFNYAYYEDDSTRLLDLRRLTPVKAGITDSTFDVTKLPRNKDYALLVTGWLQAKEDGYYTFYFRNKKDARLFIGDQLLVQYDENLPPYLPYYIPPGSAKPDDPSPIPVAVEYHR